MAVRDRPPRFLKPAFIAAAALFVNVAWTGSAHATCGDYLAHAYRLSRADGVAAIHPVTTEAGSPIGPGPAAPACRDGSCRRNLPVPPQPRVSPRAGDQWACPVNGDVVTVPSSEAVAERGAAAVFAPSYDSPLRPPRPL